tara:strand:- start:129 stop:320 length:192 start_codon:yes stop_codon:yes gene_type:complete
MEDYYDNEFMNNVIESEDLAVVDTSPEAWVDDSQWNDNTVLSDAEIDAEIFAGQVMKMLKKAA